MVRAWDNTPVFDDYEAFLKLRMEKDQIHRHFSANQLLIILNLSSDTTGETHAFPIFKSDTMHDLCNRYSDLFPVELKQAIKEVEGMNQTLYDSKGMSKERINMAELRLPLTLYTILSTKDPNFWKELDAKKIRMLRSYFGNLKIGVRRDG